MEREGVQRAPLDEAKEFLKPALVSRKSRQRDSPVLLSVKAAGDLLKESAAGRILHASSKAITIDNARQVISDAASHLKSIDKHVKTRGFENGPALDTSLLSVVNPLLDILVLEGVYPSISPEIGFRDRLKKRSLLYNKDSDRFPHLDML